MFMKNSLGDVINLTTGQAYRGRPGTPTLFNMQPAVYITECFQDWVDTKAAYLQVSLDLAKTDAVSNASTFNALVYQLSVLKNSLNQIYDYINTYLWNAGGADQDIITQTLFKQLIEKGNLQNTYPWDFVYRETLNRLTNLTGATQTGLFTTLQQVSAMSTIYNSLKTQLNLVQQALNNEIARYNQLLAQAQAMGLA